MKNESAPRLTHQEPSGRARMVDVGAKAETQRAAVATGTLRMASATFAALRAGQTPKGDPLIVAQIAGVQAAKRTAELIPLCHTLPLTDADVEFELDETLPGVHVRAATRVIGRTGVEMEALTAVSVALLTLYDMLKAIDRGMQLEGIRLLRKEGGRSGVWTADESPSQNGGS
jgi:cyclic pyranopterin phosphate synthase